MVTFIVSIFNNLQQVFNFKQSQPFNYKLTSHLINSSLPSPRKFSKFANHPEIHHCHPQIAQHDKSPSTTNTYIQKCLML